MGGLSDELLRAGLITENQAKRERIQSERREKRKSVGMNSRNRFASVKEFLEELPRRLRESSNMKEVLRDAHWLGDDLALNRNKRGKLHAFLCRIQENISWMNGKEREEFAAKEVKKY